MSEELKTPTNWPNPERPGVPMFPERDGWHVLQYYVVRNGKEIPMGDPVLSWWGAHLSVWRLKPEGQIFSPPDQVSRDTVKYVAPVITPTQITEMLAGERERAAKVCEDAYEKSGRDFEYLGCNDAAQQIRNLGDAT